MYLPLIYINKDKLHESVVDDISNIYYAGKKIIVGANLEGVLECNSYLAFRDKFLSKIDSKYMMSKEHLTISTKHKDFLESGKYANLLDMTNGEGEIYLPLLSGGGFLPYRYKRNDTENKRVKSLLISSVASHKIMIETFEGAIDIVKSINKALDDIIGHDRIGVNTNSFNGIIEKENKRLVFSQRTNNKPIISNLRGKLKATLDMTKREVYISYLSEGDDEVEIITEQ